MHVKFFDSKLKAVLGVSQWTLA